MFTLSTPLPDFNISPFLAVRYKAEPMADGGGRLGLPHLRPSNRLAAT